jgi:hypothetical protein
MANGYRIHLSSSACVFACRSGTFTACSVILPRFTQSASGEIGRRVSLRCWWE